MEGHAILPPGGLKIPPEGYKINLYFLDGYFFLEMNGLKLKMDPWSGVQLEVFIKEGRSWKRQDVSKYESLDVLNYLKKVDGKNLP